MKLSFFLLAYAATATLASPFKRAVVTKTHYTTTTRYEYPDGTPVDPTDIPRHGGRAGKKPTYTVVPADPKPTKEPKPTDRTTIITKITSSTKSNDATSTVQPDKPSKTPENTPPPKEEPAYDSYASVAVKHHNYHRSNHSSPDIAYDETLAKYALATAKTCVFKHDMSQGDGKYGQNLAMQGTTGDLGTPEENLARSITNGWYNNEFDLYDNAWGKEPSQGGFMKWGHLTQVLWADTTKVGCATVKCPAGTIINTMPSYYTVCNYRSPGNVGGSYGKNVKPPKGGKVVTV